MFRLPRFGRADYFRNLHTRALGATFRRTGSVCVDSTRRIVHPWFRATRRNNHIATASNRPLATFWIDDLRGVRVDDRLVTAHIRCFRPRAAVATIGRVCAIVAVAAAISR